MHTCTTHSHIAINHRLLNDFPQPAVRKHFEYVAWKKRFLKQYFQHFEIWWVWSPWRQIAAQWWLPELNPNLSGFGWIFTIKNWELAESFSLNATLSGLPMGFFLRVPMLFVCTLLPSCFGYVWFVAASGWRAIRLVHKSTCGKHQRAVENKPNTLQSVQSKGLDGSDQHISNQQLKNYRQISTLDLLLHIFGYVRPGRSPSPRFKRVFRRRFSGGGLAFRLIEPR